jgi:hypothetical protein
MAACYAKVSTNLTGESIYEKKLAKGKEITEGIFFAARWKQLWR